MLIRISKFNLLRDTTDKGGPPELVTLKQGRLLCLGCYSGDLDTLQTLLKHVKDETSNIRTSNLRNHKWFDTVVSLACDSKYVITFTNLLDANSNAGIQIFLAHHCNNVYFVYC